MMSKGKIAKLVQKCDLVGIGKELERYWTPEANDRMSLRELADYFNKEVLAQVLYQNAISALDGEAANYYRLLTADDISSGTRTQIENRLEPHGIDVEKLKRDFVTHQAIHTYLTKERNVTYNQPELSDEKRMNARIETIGRLKNRLVAVVEQTISEFAQCEGSFSGDTHVMVLVQVQCTDCDTQYPITELLTKGGYKCRPTTN